jgi:site-specific recombinase XerD
MNKRKGEVKPQTLNLELSVFRVVSEYAAARGIYPTDFMKLIKNEPVTKKLKEVIELDFNEVIEKATENERNTFSPARNCAILAVFCLTGMRCDELRNIKLSDMRKVKIENDEVWEIKLEETKTDVERLVYIPTQWCYLIENYLEELAKKNIDEPHLFISEMPTKALTRQLTNSGIGDICTKITGLSPHKFRSWTATTLAEHGIPIEKAAQYLGNTVQTCAEYYTRLREKDKVATGQVFNGLKNQAESDNMKGEGS